MVRAQGSRKLTCPVILRRRGMRRFAIFLLALAGWSGASAHSGGLDARGCHHNRKTGDYHCHRPAQSAQPPRRQSLLGGAAFSYPNCSAARAAGAAPIRVGEPGYGRHLDRDGDGIACE